MTDEATPSRSPEQPGPASGAPSSEAEPPEEAEPESAAADSQAPGGEDDGAEHRSSKRELSDEEADRFADSIRPSWDPPPMSGPAPAAVRLPPSAPIPTATSAHFIDESLAPSSVPVSKQRTRALALTAICVAGFAALVGVALYGPADKASVAWGDDEGAEASSELAATSAAPERAADPDPVLQDDPVESTESTAPTSTAPDDTTATTEDTAASGEEAAEEVAPVTPAVEQPPTADDPAAQAAALEAVTGAVTGSEDSAATEDEATAQPAATSAKKRQEQAIRLRITTRPTRAKLMLDGHEIRNPYDARLTPDRDNHVVTASAAGYRTRSLRVDFARDRSLTMRLRKQPPKRRARPARRKAPTRAATPPPSEPPRAVLKVTPSAPPSAPPPKQPSKGAAFVSESPY